MADYDLEHIKQQLAECSDPDKRELLNQLRSSVEIHQLEKDLDAPAEMILEAIHRASDMTKWMLRGVVAEAAFARHVLPSLPVGWKDVSSDKNLAHDYTIDDGNGEIGVQVKRQRTTSDGIVNVSSGRNHQLEAGYFIAELQKSRTGTKKKSGKSTAETIEETKEEKSRPYRYSDFEILAVSMHPSTGDWSRFRYTLARWLIGWDGHPDLVWTYQPVAKVANADWTDEFTEAVEWYRSAEEKTIAGRKAKQPKTQKIRANKTSKQAKQPDAQYSIRELSIPEKKTEISGG